MSVKIKILREKLSLGLHIVRLSEDSLARRMWNEQLLYGWPGLSDECGKIAKKLGIEDINTTSLSKIVYRKEATEACHCLNEKRLCEDMAGKRKCDKILAEGYGRKEYFSIAKPEQVRQYYATRTNMLAIAGNFSKDRRFKRTNWLCRCGQREEQEHLLRHCLVYDDIRARYHNLDNDDNLVPFFQEVLKKRDRIIEEEKKDNEEDD